jgi:formate-dependent nitrite reductase membrane component NrfD
VGGLAGAAQLIAQVADLVGRPRDRAVVRAGRYVALLGALVSPVVLVKDLHTPSRWYNMLRIFRPTSPMSIGSWTLTIFGTLSGLGAAAQVLQDLFGAAPGRRLARLFGLPAAMAGALMSVYTGTLLAATSTPLWAIAPRHLPALFGASATATASAALSLILEITDAPRRALRPLQRLALVAKGAELALTVATLRHWRANGLAAPLDEPRLAAGYRLGAVGLGVVGPLMVHALHVLTGREARRLSILADAATLVGGYILRAVLVFAGQESGRRPEDYFRIARPAPGDGRWTTVP